MIEFLIALNNDFENKIEAERQLALAIDAGKLRCLDIPYALQVLHNQRQIHTAKLETLRSNQADLRATIQQLGGSI